MLFWNKINKKYLHFLKYMYALNETVFLCIKKQLLFTSLHGRLFSFMTHYT